jgi:hypothetical protein
MKSEPGPPATLGTTAAAGARIVVWCKACGHSVEPDPGEMAERSGAEVPVPDWAAKLVGRGGEARLGGVRESGGPPL